MATRRTRNGRTVWEDSVRVPQVDGTFSRRYVYGKTKRDVLRAKQELLDERDGKPRAEQPDMLLGDLARLVMERHVKAKRPKTQQMYRAALVKRIAPYFFDVPVGSITTEMVEQWMAALAAEVEPETRGGRPVIGDDGQPVMRRVHGDPSINIARRVLVSILNRGKKWGYVGERNVAEHADRLRVDQKRANVYTAADIATIAQAGLDRRLAQSFQTPRAERRLIEYRGARDMTMVMVLAFAGLRIGELVALRWRNVGTEHLRIEHAQHAGDPLGPTKTGRPRDVPMTPEVIRALAWWRTITPLTARGDFVFPGGDGDTPGVPMWCGNWRVRSFIPNARHAGFPEARPHDMRHTFASLAIDNGVSSLELSEWMGHSDETTTRLYMHLFKLRRTHQAHEWSKGIWD